MAASTKAPVRLRQRVTKSGNTSLYLDIYHKGRRRYEYLNLYLVPENTKADKEANRETLRLAEAVCAKRLVEFRNGEYGFDDTASGNDVMFEDYFQHIMNQRKGSTKKIWSTALKHLRNYGINRLKIGQVDKAFMDGFRRHILKVEANRKGETLKTGSAAIYFTVLCTVMNQAYKDGMIRTKVSDHVSKIRGESMERTYLSVDELRVLAATPCRYDVLRRAFLFGCLTGLRCSDIRALKWRDVTLNGEFTRITFRQVKTKKLEYYDITPQAAELLGERGDDGDAVFKGFYECARKWNIRLREWADDAGLTKRLTFHSSRHTFATVMLGQGVDIYTVSKLLGHTNIATTQIYAKIVDKGKQKAVLQFPNIDVK